MVARVVGRSKLAGLTRLAGVYHILAAAADEDAEQYYQIARLRDVFSIDTATGSDLDDRGSEVIPSTPRLDAIAATTNVIFSRPGTTGTVTYPAGAIVAASDSQGAINFKTTAAVTILNGNTDSAPVPVTCSIKGSRGNVAANTITRMTTRIPGITSVTNPSVVSNGRDREKDPDFRARIKMAVRSLSRGTVLAIAYGALNARLSDGARVLFATVSEDPTTRGLVYVYVDDGTGGTDTYDSTYSALDDTLIASATGGEKRAFTTLAPIRDDGSFVLSRNAVALVRGVDYVLNPASGQVTFIGVYSGGLTALDAITARYRAYTRLIKEAQRIIDGDTANEQVYPGVRAGGVLVIVQPPQVVPQTVTAGIVVADGFDTDAVATKVAAAISDYINNLPIGDDVIAAEVVQRAMDVDGMSDFLFTNLTGSTPPSNQTIADHQVARIAAADISLT